MYACIQNDAIGSPCKVLKVLTRMKSLPNPWYLLKLKWLDVLFRDCCCFRVAGVETVWVAWQSTRLLLPDL